MKRGGASGGGMQFTASKTNAQQAAPASSGSLGTKSKTISGEPTRTRIVAGGCAGREVNLAATYGRGANDGSKASPRKKAW